MTEEYPIKGLALKERVARKMYEDAHKRIKNCHPWDGSGLDDEHPGARKRWLGYAASAIEALSPAEGGGKGEDGPAGELKPCPFCGPGQSQVGLWYDDIAKRWRVGCGRCGASTGTHPRDKTEAPAIAAWNRRSPQPPQLHKSEMVEKLRAAAELYEKQGALGESPDLLRQAATALSSAEERETKLKEVLEPFGEFADGNVDDEGWTAMAPKNDRIVDWFGPSDFRRAREAAKPT